MRVIVTRPPDQARAWVEALAQAGLVAETLPLIDIQAPVDGAAVSIAWGTLASHTLVFFVSPNAVQWFFDQAPRDAGWPPTLWAGSTGPGTTSALVQRGVAEDRIVTPDPAGETFDSQALWQQICHWPWQDASVLIVRGEDGRDWFADRLGEAGAAVEFVAAYRRCVPAFSPAEQALVARVCAEPAQHLWLFSSSEAVRNLQALAPKAVASGAAVLATHPRIAQTAREVGFADVSVCAPTLERVAQEIRARSIQSAAP